MSSRIIAACAMAALSLVGCGSGNGGGSGSSSCTPGNTASMTIKSTGLSPSAVCLLPGGTLTIQNGDTAPHDIESGATCPMLNVGTIAAGPSVNVTMPTAETCVFQDADNPTNGAFQGTVAVSSSMTSGGGY